MRHQDETERRLCPQPLEHLNDVVLGVFVEVASGFVGQQKPRLVDQSAGDGHASLLAAREFRGVSVRPAPQLRAIQQCARPRIGVGGIQRVTEQCRQGDIVDRLEIREQARQLEDEAERAAAQIRQPGLGQRPDVLLVDQHTPRRGPSQRADHREQR